MTLARVRLGAAILTLCSPLTLGAAPAPQTPTAETATAQTGTAQTGTAQTGTVEEQRLDRAAPQEILRRSGFADAAPDFARALREADSYAEARRVVVRHGTRLWERAVDRVQGRAPVADGELSRDDDRPLYWARLGMTRELRALDTEFELSDSRRTALLGALERTSRGQDDIRYPARAKGEKRVLLTGFDPFTLDRDVRISNPSGAAALALDGTYVRTADGRRARVEVAVFPVRWQDFADGAVERALRPHLARVDAFTTVSQGRVGRFDVERYNGAWRGGFPDNLDVSRTETVPVTDPDTQPQWTRTTLPCERIVAADTGPFPVYDNTEVTEIPAGASEPVERPDGPTEGSTARAGGGGDYLSNEIAYRATLLRDRLGLRDELPGGHVHTPVLQFGAGNTDPADGTVTDPEFVRDRLAIVAQVRAIVGVVASEG
ncbi:pyroglutamyl peptidase [Streptomyces luteolus]|uniref:Pyroglutamyl peptidase n=1 Tax=Streptomyces luteolus TaxID=3043615 RepID=A0ABT6SW45_9ACTN|nr:pyroglutamyl peptidase [Streptomyces sp. B-S-A12]MDI3419834.1 pyroglutamyl peptidase [Streptomyces sp. B-S-A12]